MGSCVLSLILTVLALPHPFPWQVCVFSRTPNGSQHFNGITLMVASFRLEDTPGHTICSKFPSSGRSVWCYKKNPRTSEVTQNCKNLQRAYMNEWVWISNVGQKQPAQPNFFSLVLFIQPKGFSDDLRGLPSWVSVHFTRSPIWQNHFYCKHFGSVAPAACCFSWPSGCLQILCELPFPQHTRDPADAQTT